MLDHGLYRTDTYTYMFMTIQAVTAPEQKYILDIRCFINKLLSLLLLIITVLQLNQYSAYSCQN